MAQQLISELSAIDPNAARIDVENLDFLRGKLQEIVDESRPDAAANSRLDLAAQRINRGYRELFDFLYASGDFDAFAKYIKTHLPSNKYLEKILDRNSPTRPLDMFGMAALIKGSRWPSLKDALSARDSLLRRLKLFCAAAAYLFVIGGGASMMGQIYATTHHGLYIAALVIPAIPLLFFILFTSFLNSKLSLAGNSEFAKQANRLRSEIDSLEKGPDSTPTP